MILILAIFSLSGKPNVQASACSPKEVPKAYTAFKKIVDSEIKTFANTKAVAEKADATLAKLISAKSPVITGWLSKRNLGAKSEDEVVREWRDYFARNFILTKYPHKENSIDTEIEKLMSAINKEFVSKDLQKTMQNRLSQSKNAAVSLIKDLSIQEPLKKKIISRIEAIELYWMKDFKSSKFSQLPLDFLDWGIAYDPVANEINIGVNSLAYPNEETYLGVFLHEIGHSFDSCRWLAFFEGEWPFTKVGECLRSSSSVAAKKRDDSQLETLVKENKISAELATSLKANPTCNKLIYPPAGLQADQLPESFADWFSAEALATLKDLNPLNIRTDLCDDKDLTQGSSYVSNDLRLNGIYYAHPKFSKLSNKDKTKKYEHCEFSKKSN